MKRTGGVIASGVISIVGSLLTILLGIGLILTTVAIRTNPLPTQAAAPPVDVTKILLTESIALLGLGVFGIVCGMSLLRLKNWARISFLVFSGLLGFFAVMGLMGTFMGAFLIPQSLPPEQAPPLGFLSVFLIVASVFWLLLLGLSVWWLYYFTRRRVKEQFLTETEIDTPRRGPLSVTIVAWLLTVGGILGTLLLFSPYPVFLFGMALSGWTARLMMLLTGAASLAAGIGMLRWRPQAHTLAIVIYGFFLLSAVCTVLLPGSFERMQTAMEQMGYPQNAGVLAFNNTFVWIGLVVALPAVGIPLWFLVTRRRAFLEACIEEGR